MVFDSRCLKSIESRAYICLHESEKLAIRMKNESIIFEKPISQTLF